MASQWGKLRNILRCMAKSKKKSRLSEDQLRRIFKAHDKNGDGCLDKEELKEAFRALGARVPGYRADYAIHYTDIDLDGVINEDEIDHLVSYAIQFGYTLD
uniref:EF-hand domain-containing protein n=1 Tax=Chenopodium quinoa TaxID=63459 RepID=A0A803LKC8_CHEQI